MDITSEILMIILVSIWPLFILYTLIYKKYKTKKEKVGIIISGLLWIIFLIANFII